MRLDVALVGAGLARSRSQAARLIADGRVVVDDRVAVKPAQVVRADSRFLVDGDRWVSRAAFKLLGALEQSRTDVPDRVLDAGASTGGFTQVCLARGAGRVYALDVGHGQLAQELADDARIVRRDGLNLRNLVLADVEDVPVDLVVADLSFISLKLVLEPLFGVLSPGGIALLLVKPQFEVGRRALVGKGVVRDEAARLAAVNDVVSAAGELGRHCDWQGVSELPGTDGNVEYFVRFRGTTVG